MSHAIKGQKKRKLNDINDDYELQRSFKKQSYDDALMVRTTNNDDLVNSDLYQIFQLVNQTLKQTQTLPIIIIIMEYATLSCYHDKFISWLPKKSDICQECHNQLICSKIHRGSIITCKPVNSPNCDCFNHLCLDCELKNRAWKQCYRCTQLICKRCENVMCNKCGILCCTLIDVSLHNIGFDVLCDDCVNFESNRLCINLHEDP